MKAQDYIIAKLDELKQPLGLAVPPSDKLESEIVRLILSKKFRKYAANDELIKHIKQAVHLNVSKNEPINLTFLHGAYKLWRLEEAPETDWAELFALMYYSKWLKPICEIYQPGIWFDFFVDDVVMTKLDNLDREEVEKYIKSYQAVIDFLKQYQPQNFKMTITPVSSQFKSKSDFWQSIDRNLAELDKNGLPILTDRQRAMVELNVRPTAAQLKDNEWREKVYQFHNAYLATKGEPGYHKGRADKILVFTQPLPSGTTISVGSTKNSVMKFWIGVGVLKPKDDGFDMTILSPSQLAKTEFDFEPIVLDGLMGKNFSKIRVIKK
jgi:hypothetical protein